VRAHAILGSVATTDRPKVAAGASGRPCSRTGPAECHTEPMASTASRNLGRISEIAQVAVRHGFGYFFETHRLTDLLPGRPKLDADVTSSQRGQHLREMLDELGPTFVKFGQLLSTRPDVVPPDIVSELQSLQDAVRPFPYEDVERVVREDLGLSVEQLFTEFDPTPVAAASIGQVHRATLPNGRNVAVKVQRPNAPRQIEADLALLYQAARLVKERVRALEFIDPRQLVDEFARSIRQELDYRLEARNAESFHHRFSGHPHVHIPRVYWSYTRTRVLTLERLEGIQLADLPLDAWEMEERRRLAYLMAETWMTMIFRHGFFHGDPHPANIFVLGDAAHIGLVDFGQVGKLSDEDMSKLTRLFIDAASERIDQLPRRLGELGVRYPKEREDEFVGELREMYSRYYGASLAEIDPLQVIREAFQLIYRLNLRLPTRFVMLDKAIATLGSVGVELYPDFNVFEVARPYARSLMLERYTPQRVLRRARSEGIELARIARDLPYQVHDVLEEVRDGQIEVGFVHKGLDEFMRKLDVAFNRLVIALVTVGGLIGSSLIGIFSTKGPQIAGTNFLSFVGFVLSGALGLWLLWGVIRSGRL
jgi:ubiquinone biosynthesis protein